MKIKSYSDVITNSSTEVFVYRGEIKENLNEYLSRKGVKGDVHFFTEEGWEEYKEKINNYNYDDLYNCFADSKDKNYSWKRVYSEYLFTTPGPLQDKLINELLLGMAGDLKEKKEKFLETKDLRYFPQYVLTYRHEQEFLEWIETNESLFPDYKDLQEKSRTFDISLLFDSWISFFDDTEMSPTSFKGELDEHECEFYRLS